MGLGKIGGFGAVQRDQPSSGHEAVEKRAQSEKAAAPRDPRLEQVAKLYEKQFLHEMMKAMRASVSESQFSKPNMAEKIFRDQLDDQYVEMWGDTGGVGFGDIIYKELSEKILNIHPEKASELRQQGPIAISDRDLTRILRAPGKTTKQVPLVVDLAKNEDGSSAKVLTPWKGTILGTRRLDDGRAAVQIGHGQGLESTFVFNGVGSALKEGAHIDKGGTIGVLAPETHRVLWNLRNSSKVESIEN